MTVSAPLSAASLSDVKALDEYRRLSDQIETSRSTDSPRSTRPRDTGRGADAHVGGSQDGDPVIVQEACERGVLERGQRLNATHPSVCRCGDRH